MNDDTEDHLRSLWLEGLTVREIGASIGLCPSALCRHAQRLGLPRRSRQVSATDRQRFYALYAEGLTIVEVASRTGFHRDTIRNALVARGISIEDRTRKWSVRHDAFAHPVTREAWYWIGMLAADGCVRGPSISLIQHTSRAAMLHRFLDFVGSPDRPFRTINGGDGSVADVSSPRLAADLALHGVVPRKSLVMEASAEAALEPMFWLGVFDGDGCCWISRAGVPTIGVVGTRALMTQFAEFLGRLYGDDRPVVGSVGRDGNPLSDVRVSGGRARQLAEHWLSISSPSVERMPSQFLQHVFCSREHYWAWRRKDPRPS